MPDPYKEAKKRSIFQEFPMSGFLTTQSIVERIISNRCQTSAACTRA